MTIIAGSGIVPIVAAGLLTAPGVTGVIAHDETITIAGTGFGTKPDPDSTGTDKPLLVFRASDNTGLPNSTLGIASAFSVANGQMVTSEKAVNSTHSWQTHLGRDKAQQMYSPKYEVHINWDEFYVFRRTMYDHDREAGGLHGNGGVHIRCRTSAGDSALVSVGDWARSQTSPFVTAQIEFKPGDGFTFRNDVGGVAWNGSKSTVGRFGAASGTLFDVYATEAEADSGSGTILETFTTNEGAALGAPYFTMNNKQMRFGLGDSAGGDGNNNCYPAMVGDTDAGGQQYNMENTSSSSYAGSSWPNQASFVLTKDEWYNEQYVYINGTIDVADSIINMYRDGVLAFASTDKMWIFTDTSPNNPDVFDRLQVNGADNYFASGCAAYNDYIYYDDSLCRALIADSADLDLDSTTNSTKFEVQVCPIVSWADTSIQCVVQRGEHVSLSGKYIHIIDSTDTVVLTSLIS